MITDKPKNIYLIKKRGDRTFWKKVGTVTVNLDGSMEVELIPNEPLDGKLHIRDVIER